jgi:hypothetical protein
MQIILTAALLPCSSDDLKVSEKSLTINIQHRRERPRSRPKTPAKPRLALLSLWMPQLATTTLLVPSG